jgi:transposase
VENLSDRQAAHAVRGRIDWKYLLGLELTDPGFDYSVLCEFRARLLAGEVERMVLDKVLSACAEAGLLEAGGTARTDATHVAAAVRVLNRLELVAETMRAALNALAVAAPQWLGAWMPPRWADRYGHRVDNYRLPHSEPERAAYAAQVGADGAALLAAVDDGQTPDWIGQVEAVVVLRQVWDQQYQMVDGRPRWREVAELPPSTELVASPYDAEARFAVKRSTGWVGYKAHLTEVCDPDRPHLLTHVETTPATEDDSVALPRVHAGLATRGLVPAEHLVDTRYMSAAGILAAERDHGVRMVGPAPVDTSWQGRAGEASTPAHLPSTGRPSMRPARRARSASVGGPGSTIMARQGCGSASATTTVNPARCVQSAPSAPAALGRWTCASSRSMRCSNGRAGNRPHPSGNSSTTAGRGSRAASPMGSVTTAYAEPATGDWRRRI